MLNPLTWIGGAVALFVFGFLSGAHWQSDQYKAAYERQVAELKAANTATETDKDRLSAELKQSEAQIDKWKKDYDDAIAKRGEAACLLSNDDVRWLQLDPKAARPKSKAK